MEPALLIDTNTSAGYQYKYTAAETEQIQREYVGNTVKVHDKPGMLTRCSLALVIDEWTR